MIDINVDVGEGMGNESLIMPLISSCNIACGGHAGDLSTMRTVVKLAKEYDVKIGAHPSFPDKRNFGRIIMDISSKDLSISLKKQIETLQAVVNKENGVLHHVKLHGALYNLAAVDVAVAHVVAEVIKNMAIPIKLYVPYKSIMADVALKHHLEITYEAFADRNYNDDLTLVSRKNENALIIETNIMFNHVYNMILHQKVKTIESSEVEILAHTFCIHGDNPNAMILIKSLKEKLELSGIKIG